MIYFFKHVIFTILLWLIFVSCSKKAVLHDSYGTAESAWDTLTINNLSLTYRMDRGLDSTKLQIHSDDPVMTARILALGLSVGFTGDNSQSIGYPMGFMEIKEFRS
mgnify:CR=1 FL=1